MIDVVIPKSSKCEWGDHKELRYCLRSLEQNVLDLGNVYIVGYKPDWLQNVIHIEAEDKLKANKDGNLINKVLLACQDKKLTDKFIRMSDDQLVLQKTNFRELKVMHVGDISKAKVSKENRWTNRFRNTLKYLQERSLSTLGYDYHIPQPYLKQEFQEVFKDIEYDVEYEGYIINTFYLNQSNQPKELFDESQKATFERKKELQIQDIMNKTKGAIYLGYNHRGLSNMLKHYIQDKFPYKSKFEK